MPRLDEGKLKGVIKFLEGIKVFTLDHLVSYLSCSLPTARLKLKQWRTYTSYNQNGRYYALPAVPRFDENGLWHHEKISFSKYGNLRNTVVNLIKTSSSGLTGNDLGNLIRLRPRSFLHHFRDVSGIRREKSEGVYIYFSDDAEQYREQLQNRSRDFISAGKLLSDADAVVILTALIRHHGITVEDIMQLAEVRKLGFPEVVIREFLDRHDLLKKTLNTKP